jgi:hypothetical protein
VSGWNRANYKIANAAFEWFNRYGGRTLMVLPGAEHFLPELPAITIVSDTVVKCGGVTFTRDSAPGSDRGEVWDATLTTREEDRKLKLTFLCVKNYGPSHDHGDPTKPGDGFHGWQVVSGGPFEWVGPTRNDAFQKGAVYIRNYWAEQAREKIAEAQQLQAALEEALKVL